MLQSENRENGLNVVMTTVFTGVFCPESPAMQNFVVATDQFAIPNVPSNQITVGLPLRPVANRVSPAL